jgi:FixJ family two-component response regulator
VSAARGRPATPLSPEATEAIKKAAELHARTIPIASGLDFLRAQRRRAVLEALYAGATAQAIADGLGISRQAVDGIAQRRRR